MIPRIHKGLLYDDSGVDEYCDMYSIVSCTLGDVWDYNRKDEMNAVVAAVVVAHHE